MAIKAPPMTAEEFEKYLLLPENSGRRLELIGGEVVELLPDECSRRMTIRFARLMKAYLDQHPIGYATPPGIGYKVGNDRYMPDIGFVSKARQPFPPKAFYNSLAPDLVFEAISPSDEVDYVVAKVMTYQLAGTTVWAAYQKQKEIQIFVPGHPMRKLAIDDTLDGGDVLPGFKAKLLDIFAGE